MKSRFKRDFFVHFDETENLCILPIDFSVRMCYNWPADYGRLGRKFTFVNPFKKFFFTLLHYHATGLNPEITLNPDRFVWSHMPFIYIAGRARLPQAEIPIGKPICKFF